MDAKPAPAPRDGRPLWLGAALGGLVGLLRLPLSPLPRFAVALVVGAGTAAATVVAVRPRQGRQVAEAGAAAAAASAGQQEEMLGEVETQLAAAVQQHQGPQAQEPALLAALVNIDAALCTASPAQLAEVGRAATMTLCAALLPRTLLATTARRHNGTCQLLLLYLTCLLHPHCLISCR
jgi:hypothetical protein